VIYEVLLHLADPVCEDIASEVEADDRAQAAAGAVKALVAAVEVESVNEPISA
jgi:hypothetical protein